MYDRGPVFNQKPAIKQIDGGKKVLFECKIAADPKPQVTWFRDTVQLSDEGASLVYFYSMYYIGCAVELLWV